MRKKKWRRTRSNSRRCDATFAAGADRVSRVVRRALNTELVATPVRSFRQRISGPNRRFATANLRVKAMVATSQPPSPRRRPTPEIGSVKRAVCRRHRGPKVARERRGRSARRCSPDGRARQGDRHPVIAPRGVRVSTDIRALMTRFAARSVVGESCDEAYPEEISA